VNWDGVVAGDFNGDGFLDLAAANDSGVISVLIGNGDGTFKPPASYTAGISYPDYIYTGDFNNDGKLDLAVVNVFNVGVLLGNGDGTFQPQIVYGSGLFDEGGAVDAKIADFDNDGNLDLVVTNPGGHSVVILLGKGDGTFQAPQSYATAPGDGPYSPYVGDLNGDGIPDLVVTTGDLESVLLGNGDGTFQTAKSYHLGGGYSLALGDLNGDGILDVVASGSGIVSVSLGVGDGTFGPRQTFPTSGQNPVIIDINQDGIPDIAVTSETGIEVLLGNGNGTFQPSVSYVTTPGVPGFMIQGDFNGDRRPDLVAATSMSSMATVVLNTQTVTLDLAGVTLPDPDKYQASYSGDSIFAATTSNLVLAPAGIQATTSALQFGEIPLGTTETLQLTITDVGVAGTVTVTGASSGPSYRILTNTCLAGISAGQSCVLGIEFSPYGVGIKNDTLTLTPSAGGAAFTVNLTGIASGMGP
jgi:FG-GAP-like repeat/Abnormal spindle-like microcephaly-assoc'd, ASPM-SPD-2-Hydin